MSGHPAPSRETGQEVADTLTVGANQYSGFNGEPVAQCLTTRTGSAYDPTTETLPVTTGALCARTGQSISVQDAAQSHLLPIAFGAQNSAHQGDSVSTEVTPTLDKSKTPAVMNDLQVRRLTPTECERLQGFPDGFTQIPWRNKAAEDCPDGPRYKAMGNSMAVPVMRWIGERIEMVENLDG